jgi:hypothetical protein
MTLPDNGVAVPATAYELRCVASEGGIVKEDPILFAFIWVGVAALAALTVMALLARPGRTRRRAGEQALQVAS